MKNTNFIGLYGGPFDGDAVMRPDKHEAIPPKIVRRPRPSLVDAVYVFCPERDEYVWEGMLEGAAT